MARRPLNTQFQPYVVGNYYQSPFGGTLQSATFARPQCNVSFFMCSKKFNFDAAGLFVVTAGSGTPAVRFGVYQMDPKTWLPATLLDDFGTVSTTGLSNTFTTVTFPSTKTYLGLIGVAIQTEGGTSNPSFTVDALNFNFQWTGYTTPTTLGSLPFPYAYSLTSGDGVVAGSFPAVNLFSYSKLQANGSGMFLRRAT